MSAHSTRRYLSLWLRRLSTDRVERHLSEQADAPRAAVAQIKGRERFEGFVDTLGKRLEKGQSFLREIPGDIPAAFASGEPGSPVEDR